MTQRFPLAHSARAALTVAAMLLVVPFTQASEIETSGSNPRPAQLGDFAVESGTRSGDSALSPPVADLQGRGGANHQGPLDGEWIHGRRAQRQLHGAAHRDRAGRFRTAWTFGEVCGSGVHTTFPPGTPGTPARPGWTLTHSTSAPAASTGWLRAWRWPVGTHRGDAHFLDRTLRSLPPDHAAAHPDRFDNHDAKILSLGVSLEVGSGIQRPREAVAAAEVRTVYKETFLCPDRDNDGVPTMWTTALTWRVRWIIGAARSTGSS